MSTKPACLFLACIAALIGQGCGPYAVHSLGADLAIDFTCSGSAYPASEAAIEKFLKARNFTVANDERMRRQLNFGFFPLQIESYDARDITVEFQGLADSPDASNWSEATVNYHATIYSPPPTKHDNELETALRSFITQDLRCKITSENASENPPEAASFYADILARQKNRMREAMVCDKTEPTFDEAACAKVPRPQ